MRPLPVPLRGVAEEPAIDLVVESTPPHRVERGLDNVGHRRILGLAMDVERELEGCGQRKLGFGPEPAMVIVERVEDPSDKVGGRRIAIRRCDIGTAARGCQLFAPRPERVRHAREHRRHALQRDVGSATDHLSLGRQKRRRRPPAQAVAVADVRAAVGVDADRHEPVVDDGRDARIGVGGAVHVQARFAPRGRNREEHGPVFGARACEGLGAPGQPADSVHDHGQL